jgi:hypothetical protein
MNTVRAELRRSLLNFSYFCAVTTADANFL